MATLIVNVENDLDTDKIFSAISLLKGVNEVIVRNKTKTDELLERMLAGEDIDDNEYFDSIPGMWETIEIASKGEFVSIEEVIPDWYNRKVKVKDV